MGLSIANSEILALFLESLLYGIFFTLFWILLLLVRIGPKNKRSRGLDVFMISTATTLLVFASAHLAIDLGRAIHAFNGRSSDETEAFFLSVTSGTFIAKCVIWVIQTFIGDIVLIWRCYSVHGSSSAYVIPAVFGSLVYLISAGAAIYEFAHASPGSMFDFHSRYYTWIVVFICSAMFINVYCTGTMAWRIFRTSSSAIGARRTRPALVAMVETGMLYTAGYTGFLISFVAKSLGQYTAVDVLSPLVGITFCVIVIHIRFHDISVKLYTSSNKKQDYSFCNANTLQAISIEILRQTEVELDSVIFSTRTPSDGMSKE